MPNESQTPRTDDDTLAKAMDILAEQIQSDDGVANAAIAEAANRLRELKTKLRDTEKKLEKLKGIANELAAVDACIHSRCSFGLCPRCNALTQLETFNRENQ